MINKSNKYELNIILFGRYSTGDETPRIFKKIFERGWFMKTLLKLFLCIALCVAVAKESLACCGGPLEGTNGIILRVEGLNTPEDANKITSAIKESPGVMEAHVYVKKGEVSVTISSSSISEESLIQGIKKAGFNCRLPTTFNLGISFFDTSSAENLKNALDELRGVMVRDIDFGRKLISIDIYKPWVKTAERLIKTIEGNGCRLNLTKETLLFKTGGITVVDAFDARAYTQLLFGVVSADLDTNEGILKIVIYKELADTDDVVRTIKDRGFSDI
ncbi:MAG: cation transporter [Candidatus Brocadia sp.]